MNRRFRTIRFIEVDIGYIELYQTDVDKYYFVRIKTNMISKNFF